MTKNIPLTLACGDYESIRALKEGSVTVDGVELTVLTDMDSASRHWRMIRGSEFDIAELSLSSYLMAVDRKQPLEAIPVFLHRRFRHGFIFINANAGIKGNFLSRLCLCPPQEIPAARSRRSAEPPEDLRCSPPRRR